MSPEAVRIDLVVEGQGEVQAVPLLVRRICHELLDRYGFETTPPVRRPRSSLPKAGELEKAVRLARLNTGGEGPVLVLLDADDDCPAELGPALRSRAGATDVAIVLANREFETWFLYAAESLRGKSHLSATLVTPPDPEAKRDAKGWLTRQMPDGHAYSPTVDQAALVAAMDLNAAQSSPSFARLCRELARLIPA
jgi:hypothetical protein